MRTLHPQPKRDAAGKPASLLNTKSALRRFNIAIMHCRSRNWTDPFATALRHGLDVPNSAERSGIYQNCLALDKSFDGLAAEPSQEIADAEKVSVQAPAAEPASPASPAPLVDLAQARPHSPSPTPSSAAPGYEACRKRSRLDTDPAINDNRASDIVFDQYYTQHYVAVLCIGIAQRYFDFASFLMVEPGAGTGSFFRLLPVGSIGVDVEPKYPGIQTADFLTFEIESNRKIAVIGNPPFGKNASMAVRFFNRAARRATYIAMILPRTFRKASVQNRLARNFHLLHEETVPDNAFIFRNKPYNVPAVFQIWERRPEEREFRRAQTRHPDFEFTIPDHADFAIQRVGARAGRVHHDFRASHSSHHFIRGNVEEIMAQLQDDFSTVAANVAGNPSLSKSEIVSLYSERLNCRSG